MLLPESRIESVDYYTHHRSHPIFRTAPEDVIVIRWKEWWRPRTRLVFPLIIPLIRNERDEVDDTAVSWRPTDEVLELLDQLRQHCRSN